jgi:hypothetical protein
MRQRYGLDRRPVGRWIALTVLGVAFVGALVFVAIGVTSNPVDSRLLTWQVVGPDRIDLTFQVKRPASAEVTCVLRAQDDKRVDVGYATVTVAPGDSELVDYRLRTIAPASTVELLGCSVDGAPSVAPPQFPPGVVPPEQPWS